MDYTIYLDFEHDNVPYAVYQVRLATSDPSAYNYGVWDNTSQSALIPYGTVVYPTQTGYYPYTLDIDNGHTYLISWEIITVNGETPIYREDTIGPYYTVDNTDIRAVATKVGKFVQGQRATLMLKVTQFDGQAEDAESVSVSIIDSVGTSVTLDTNTPEHVDTGFYVYDWVISSTQAIGEYRVIWSYRANDVDKAELQDVVVSADATDTLYYSGRVLEFRLALEHHLACAQSIPIYQEPSKPTRDSQTFEFTFPRWNQSTGIKIYKNENIVNSGVEVDFFNGKITFDDALTTYDSIVADYNFKWFSDEQLYRYLNNAVQMLNIYPPASGYTLENVPDRYIPGVLYGAARDALRQLIMCLQFQQPQQVFGGSEAAQRAFAAFDSLKQNYEKDFTMILEQKKFGPYPRVRIIISPELSLPGGRSISPYTTMTYINYGNPNSVYNSSFKDLYCIYKSGEPIEILSHSDKTGNMVFAPITHIWESGIKDTYELKTKNGFDIRSSDEHLFYVNGKYIPLMNIKIGDSVITSDNHTVEESVVKSIKKIRGKEKMLDMEVYGTANLFANGIKCHNSRWFRYLFKGSQ